METISLYNPNTERTQVLEILSQQSIPHSSEHAVKLTARQPNRQNPKIVHLVTKRAKHVIDFPTALESEEPWDPMTFKLRTYTDILWDIWHRLSTSGHPVVPTMWLTDNDLVAMTDLTAKGGAFYDKSARGIAVDQGFVDKDLDKVFLDIDERSITDAALRAANKATFDRIALSRDDAMSLFVLPDGSFKIYLLDIGLTRFDTDLNTAKTCNIDGVASLQLDLARIKQMLGDNRPTYFSS